MIHFICINYKKFITIYTYFIYAYHVCILTNKIYKRIIHNKRIYKPFWSQNLIMIVSLISEPQIICLPLIYVLISINRKISGLIQLSLMCIIEKRWIFYVLYYLVYAYEHTQEFLKNLNKKMLNKIFYSTFICSIKTSHNIIIKIYSQF